MNASLDLSKVLDWLPNAELENVIATALISTPIAILSSYYLLPDKLIYISGSIILLSGLASSVSIGSLLGRLLTHCRKIRDAKKQKMKEEELRQKYYKIFKDLRENECETLRSLVQATLYYRSFCLSEINEDTVIDMRGFLQALEKDNLIYKTNPFGCPPTYMANSFLIERFSQQQSG